MANGSVTLLKGKIDVSEVIKELNAALAEEWLAYYQYWTAAQVVVGAQRSELRKEFITHAEDELRHAEMVCDRIIELEGVPILVPEQWFEVARCKYEMPKSFDSQYFLQVIRAAEVCAMHRYQEIAEMTENKDFVTNDLAKFILAEEADHEQDMQDFIDDMNSFKAYMAQ